MAREIIFDSLDKVPADLQAECIKAADGRYHLPVEDVRALKSANERNKADNADIKTLRKELNLSVADIRALASANKDLLATRAELNAAKIQNQITIALMTGRATAEGMELLGDRLARRVTIEDGAFRISGADGKPLAGSGTDGLATFADLTKEAIEKYPMLFQGTGAGGGGSPTRGPRSNGLPPKTLLRSDFERLSPTDRHTKIVKEGYSVIDG